MSCCAHDHCGGPGRQPNSHRFRRVLWAALAINATLFPIEIVAGLAAGSASLQADALAKGATMGVFGLWVAGTVVWHALHGTLPEAETMGVVGFAALIANGACFGLLWAYREGDSNMRSVSLCSRNDVLGNLAVLLAALGVFGTGTGWPDVIVAAVMSGLALQGAWQAARHALNELRQDRHAAVTAE